MLWLCRDDLSVIFSFDYSWSIAVIRVFRCFENAGNRQFKEIWDKKRLARCFEELVDYAFATQWGDSEHVVINVDLCQIYQTTCVGRFAKRCSFSCEA